jgi:hypothetical protein
VINEEKKQEKRGKNTMTEERLNPLTWLQSKFAQLTHTHGNLTSDGKLGTTSGKPVITTTSGAITTGSFGTTSGSFAEGNHTHSNYISTSSTTGLIKNDGSIMASGTGSTNYAAGNHTHSGYVSATKVTSWSSTVSDSNVPSEKLVKDYIDQQIGTAIQYIQQ